MPLCYLSCRYGYKEDDNGCAICSCNPPPEGAVDQTKCPKVWQYVIFVYSLHCFVRSLYIKWKYNHKVHIVFRNYLYLNNTVVQ